jgi:gamma-glutamyl hercynylcysteine S-oxide synthase
VAGPYKDYSAPWFGNHRELRGGAFATDALLHDVCFRNFFVPERNDVFAGFRSVTP